MRRSPRVRRGRCLSRCRKQVQYNRGSVLARVKVEYQELLQVDIRRISAVMRSLKQYHPLRTSYQRNGSRQIEYHAQISGHAVRSKPVHEKIRPAMRSRSVAPRAKIITGFAGTDVQRMLVLKNAERSVSLHMRETSIREALQGLAQVPLDQSRILGSTTRYEVSATVVTLIEVG